MKIKNIKVILAWSIPALLLLFSFFNFIETKNKNKDFTKFYLQPYEISVSQSLQIDNHFIPDLSFINLKNTNSVNILNESKHENYLIVVYSEHSCNPCSELLLNFCNELTQSGYNKIYGIFNYEDMNEAKRFVINNYVNYPSLYDPENQFMEKLKITESPVILWVDKNNNIINSHFLQPELENITRIFFDYIRSQVITKPSS
ncbi:MAG: redoxin domain-containing protein [Ignavibacteriales bacterium]|nr:redoxin domain-containing protein [Ignavibacteriales bacterium]